MNLRNIPHIVFDTATIGFQNNRVFDPTYAAKFPGALVWSVLSNHVTKRGWEIMTSDVFLKKPVRPSQAFCISEMVTPFTMSVLESGAVPLVIMSAESPNVACEFYHNLNMYTQLYRHAFLFSGAGERVGFSTLFHPLYWPNTCRDVKLGLGWNERQFLVMVAGNKHRFLINEHKPLKSLRRLVKRLVWSYMCFTDKLFQLKDLYQERADAICYFADVSGFRLFGTGWDIQRSLNNAQWQVIQKLKPTFVEDKMDVLGRFRFAVCFENCVFPGYVTEKIFDCFMAGCIPIYLGAPDISDFVPASSFIDYRHFGNYTALERFMRQMTEPEAFKYLKSAREFLASPEFEKFTADWFVNNLMDIIGQEFDSQSKKGWCPPIK